MVLSKKLNLFHHLSRVKLRDSSLLLYVPFLYFIIFLCFRIRLQISHEAAACITALRAAMEALVVEVTKQPNIISQLDPVNEHMLNMIRQISRPSAAGINLMIGSTR